MYRLEIALSAAALFACCGHAAGFGHCICDSVSLDGEWEMAYRTNAFESVECPVFRGARIAGAVPGYWEDMRGAFSAAGLGPFVVNPHYLRQSFPISGSAYDTTLPDISGCFLYRRTVNLDREGPAYLAFEGVRNEVRVWANGKFVAARQGFSTPFELEIPDGILRIGENEIVLAVSNRPNRGYDGSEVSGLTTRGLFASTGGISGHVELRFK